MLAHAAVRPPRVKRGTRRADYWHVPRLLLAALTGLVTLALTAPAASAAPVEGPLSTSGARIVDARGRTVVLQGVNWFGFETSNHVVHGLWTRDHDDVLAQVRRLGFNTIRLPFSLQALRVGHDLRRRLLGRPQRRPCRARRRSRRWT